MPTIFKLTEVGYDPIIEVLISEVVILTSSPIYAPIFAAKDEPMIIVLFLQGH